MKLFKIIAVSSMATILVVSLVLNVLLLCGFQFSKVDNTVATVDKQSSISDTGYLQVPPAIKDTEVTKKDDDTDLTQDTIKDVDVTDVDKDTNISNTGDDSDDNTFLAKTTGVIYEDNNIKITYVQSEKKAHGFEHTFNIENLSTKALNVSFTNLCINGRAVYISGLTCDKLLPGTTVAEELVLIDTDWEQYPEEPDYITFNIKFTNTKSYLDLYETDRIVFEV